jgi:propanediol dehydratase small subunit
VIDVAEVIRALSGKAVEQLTVEAVRAGEVGVADLRVHPGSTATRSWRRTCAARPS